MPAKKTVPSNFFNNLPRPVPRGKVINRFFENKQAQLERASARLSMAKEKKFSDGCTIRWTRKPSVVRTLKHVSTNGFLIIEGASSNRENPDDWEVVE